MALYDKASLVLIPSGTKEGVVFSQKPTNGDGDFTFSRSTAATRVNADGLIEKETQNLILYSNTFDTGWIASGTISATSGQSGYDGSSDAWLLTKSTASAYTYQNVSSGLRTISVYAKAGSLNWLYILKGGNSGQYFNLASGVLGGSTGPSPIDANITSVGGGWYRCSLTYTHAFAGSLRIYPANGDGDVSGTSGNIYIQDAQLNQGLVADSYLETTTTAVYGGITDNIPRLDYTDASCPSLLLEPQRTNKLTHSEYINTTTFNQTANLTISNAYAISPEGVNNAAKITPDATNSYHQLRTSLATLGGTDILSAFVKADGYNYVQLTSWAQPANYVNFDLTNGSVSALGSIPPSVYGIEDYGNGWYRIYANVQASGGGVVGIGVITYATAGWAQSFVGNGTDGILIYGCQLEDASYATSYIPTYGTSVTFARDACYGAGNASTFNSEEGVFYFEGSALANDGTNRYLSIDDGTTSNYIYFRYVSTSNNVLFRTAVAGVTINTLATSLPDTTQNHKFAFKWKSGDYAFWIDGVEVGTDTSSTIFSPNVLSNIEFSFPTDGGGGFASNTRQIMIFNTALTDEELEALTQV